MVWVEAKCTLVSYAYGRRLKVRENHIEGIFMITGKGQQGRETQTLRKGEKGTYYCDHGDGWMVQGFGYQALRSWNGRLRYMSRLVSGIRYVFPVL